jgi:hypothetical protein
MRLSQNNKEKFNIITPSELVKSGEKKDKKPIKKSGPDRKLNEQQRRFVSNLLNPKFKSNADAYSDAYPGTNMSRQAMSSEAYKLKKKPHIKAYIDKEVKVMESKRQVNSLNTRNYVENRLMEESERGYDTTPSSRLKALELLGKTVGLYIDVKHTEVNVPDSTNEILKEIEEIISRSTNVKTIDVEFKEHIPESID